MILGLSSIKTSDLKSTYGIVIAPSSILPRPVYYKENARFYYSQHVFSYQRAHTSAPEANIID